ncbi:MAG: Hsp70 family protein, partial [Victivallales bacterium]|nr:Hsp70 family protein [Victivallales bacterium]
MKKAAKEEKRTPRYSVGIDLGTTNSILSYVDLTAEEKRPQTLPIPQVVAPGETQALPMLPSFIYMPPKAELGKGLYDLPWAAEGGMVVGAYAQARSAEAPSRVVYSSKSWLCNDRIDRHSQCLPLCPDDATDIEKISPVDAARTILEYLRDAWNHTMAADDDSLRLERQSIVITVPASFDAVARELTVEAATAAGLEFTLLEEPQAAFYSWLADHDTDWRGFASEGDVILVCDIGGGTTDFSLIAVKDNGGELELQRIAVGNHTLLGGDNMDMTLAMSISQKFAAEKNIRLNQYQFIALTHACRRAKEAIGGGAQGPQPITIMGRGSSLLASTISTQVTEDDLR